MVVSSICPCLAGSGALRTSVNIERTVIAVVAAASPAVLVASAVVAALVDQVDREQPAFLAAVLLAAWFLES